MRSLLSVVFALCFFSVGTAYAQEETLADYARNCDKRVGGTVPKFNCLDGGFIKIINKQGDKCENPSNLINSCNEFNRVGKLESGNPDVDVRFLCRHYTATTDPNDPWFDDIAVVQHNRVTGATCFYQSNITRQNGQDVPAPKSGDTRVFDHGMVRTGDCAKCHDNRGFIRTANIRTVEEPHAIPKPPKETFHYRFPGEVTKNWRVYKVKSTDRPTCSNCHSIGAYSVNGQFNLQGSSGDLGFASTRNTQVNLLPNTAPWMGFDALSAEAHHQCASNHNAPGCQVTQFEAPDWDDKTERETQTQQLVWASFTSSIRIKAGEELGRLVYTASGGNGIISYSHGHPNDECSWDWPRPENGEMIITGRAPTSGLFTLNGKTLQPGENRCNIRLIAESAGQRAELDINVIIDNGSKGGIYPQDGQVLSLRSKHSGKCLDLRDWNQSNGADLQQWDCNGGAAQKFRFQADGKGAFALVNLHANKCVSVRDFTKDDGGRVHSWDCYGNSDQKYRLQPNAFPGTYSFHFEHSNKCLDVSGPSVDNGAIVHQWSCLNDAANQACELVP